MMVTAISETISRNQTTRPPLLPSEKDNDIITPKNPIRPKSRQVSSRYLSPSPSSSNSNSVTNSRRSPSPLISRNSTTPAAKRSVSADRKRPTKPDLSLKPNNAGGAAGDVSAATKLLVTSRRSLSVSFQGEAFSLPISKTKVTPQSPNNARKCTPERKRNPTPLRGNLDNHNCVGDHFENTRPVDQHRWPARIRQPDVTVLSKSLSSECGGNVVRGLKLHQSIHFDNKRASFDGERLNLDLGNSNYHNLDGNSVKDPYSDTDSVSSGSSTSGFQENGSNRLRNGSKGIIVSPKFWQETNSRMRRLQDPSSPISISPQKKLISKRFSGDTNNNNNNPLSSPRTMSSPNRMRPSSPSKLMTSSLSSPSKLMTSSLSSPSPSRGMISPRRNSVCGISPNFSETKSVLSFAVDVRRGKVGENRFFDAHLLRLLYNRQLQWRFVNARNEDIILKQKHNVEENLWNAWITISDLRDSVTKKQHRLQLLRQKLKLASILRAQINYLEGWGYLDKDHLISLLGAIEALKATTLRLPLGARATVDLQSMKDAINSTLDVMQEMCSSMNSLCLQVEETNLMVSELAKVSAKERTLLRICKDFLSVLAALKVKDSSLRTHMLQTNRVK